MSDMPLVPGIVGGAGQQAEPVGLGAVRDVELGAVDDPLVAVAHGPGADAGDVAAGVGLGDRDGGHDLAPDGRREIPLLQLVRAVAGQRRRRHRHLDGHGHRDAAAADPAHLLAGDRGCRCGPRPCRRRPRRTRARSSPTAASLGKSSWAGNVRAASHSSTWGSISRSKRSRSVLRNSWCSSLSITGERYHRPFSAPRRAPPYTAHP